MLTAVVLAAFCLPAAAGQEDLAALCPGKTPPGASDGSTTEHFGGPGQDQITLGQKYYIPRRDARLAAAEQSVGGLTTAMLAVEAGQDLPALKQRIAALSGEPLDQARDDVLEALRLETLRLRAVLKAVRIAGGQGATVPGVEPGLVEKRLKALEAPETRAAIDAYVAALRELAAGLTAFIDGDRMVALERAKAAAATEPRLALAQVYIGSFSYLLEQYDAAREAWQKALELDPGNEAVRRALEGKGKAGARLAAAPPAGQKESAAEKPTPGGRTGNVGNKSSTDSTGSKGKKGKNGKNGNTGRKGNKNKKGGR